MLAALMVGLLLVVILPVLGMGRKVRRMSKDSQDRVADTSALAGEVLNAMQTVQAFGREPYERDRYGLEVERAFSTARRRIRSRALMTAVAIVLAFGVIVFVLWLSAQAKAEGHMTAGELAQFILYATLTAGAIAALAEVWGEVQRASGATERLVELMRDPEPIEGQAFDGALELPIDIQFEAVRFAYPSRPDHWVLNGLTLNIPAGQTIALVGHSGAGKSTVLALILGFYRPQAGRILINGIDLWEMGSTRARALMGLVPQDPVVFSGDAWANIRYGDLDATDDHVLQAARAAHADEFISTLPNGYATFLGERGLRLSGGQRQRLAIARAILRNPPVLLLDEATSALDTLSERAVQAALETLLPGRTAVVVAHRLSTVRKAHQIAVLDQGVCVAIGSHDDLRGTSPLYAALCAEQFVDESARPEPVEPVSS
jgi:ATP-binding cassette subfamily B protein